MTRGVEKLVEELANFSARRIKKKKSKKSGIFYLPWRILPAVRASNWKWLYEKPIKSSISGSIIWKLLVKSAASKSATLLRRANALWDEAKKHV